ncbi:hypothetical protein CCH79_00011260 [Gambusia affinis]|uniref:Sushi domain-containing protein n=1 Tax=Gambusia affinis TaxID=33528 RepID=A0A315V4D2_GAMAF|nr:hypothetical protein CCH79_00011260 [Gambusia affinis]
MHLGGALMLLPTPTICHPGLSPVSETGTTYGLLDNCGKLPQVPEGLSEPHEQRYLKYTCQEYYKLVGPDIVVCHGGGTWSEVPTCKEDFCHLNTTEYPDLLDTGNPFIRNGDTEKRECVDKWKFTNYAVVQCIEGKLSVSRCCNKAGMDTQEDTRVTLATSVRILPEICRLI